MYDEIVKDSSCIYDKDRVEEFYSSRPLLVLSRLVQVGAPVFDWWIAKKIDSFLIQYRTPEENQYFLKQRASDLREAIVKGKSVTFIKSGQALALRPDLIKSVE
jgi:predicted unusual protein kinase regulating ubiquinone biosynthesis (AarF/ABC1/UbiB family)